jgi:hypothetical protein
MGRPLWRAKKVAITILNPAPRQSFSVLAVPGTIANNARSPVCVMKRPVETTEDFKARIAAIIGDKTEHIAGARPPHPLLVRKKRTGHRKAKRPKRTR